jgi:EEF1A lysine methyltransferase 4
MTNIDISSVVINQQKAKYPHLTWLQMDVLEMTFPNESFDAVVDKSLIDTLLCSSNR